MPSRRINSGSDDSDSTSTSSSVPSQRKWTCWLVVISLVIFTGFAVTLLLGLLSGDPNGIYSKIVIGFIGLAIVSSIVMLLYYIRSHRSSSRKSLKSGKSFTQIQGTFSPSDEEVFDANTDDVEAPPTFPHNAHYDEIHYKKQPPVNAIVKGTSVAGEMSALSPYSFEIDGFDGRVRPEELGDGYTPEKTQRFGQHTPGKNPYGIRTKSRIPFDFNSVESAQDTTRNREDPPEQGDEIMYDDIPSRNHKKSLDPSAPKISAEGFLVGADDNPTPRNKTPRRWSLNSSASRRKIKEPPTPANYSEPVESDVPININLVEEQPLSPTSTVASVATYLSKAKSTVSTTSKAKSTVSTKSVVTPKSAKSPKKSSKASDKKALPVSSGLPQHSKAQSEVMFSMSEKTKPAAPASEVGSTVSSMFLKPFNAVFGSSKKKTPTKEKDVEAGSSVPTPKSAAPTPKSVASPKSKAPDTIADSRSDVGSSFSVKQSGADPKKLATPPRNAKPPMPMSRNSSGKKRPQSEQPVGTIDGGNQRRRAPSKERPPVSNRPPSAGNRFGPAGPPSAVGSEYAQSDFKSTAGSSVFSGAASSTYDPQARERALRRTQRNDNALGAAPVSDDSANYYDDDQSTDINRSDVYDVIAPPGPIGIIVDTSDDGPVVHSLKKSSPMLGLINTGDVILALDDEDVRKMTAATLTKLMARKSRQAERKITLMPLDDY